MAFQFINETGLRQFWGDFGYPKKINYFFEISKKRVFCHDGVTIANYSLCIGAFEVLPEASDAPLLLKFHFFNLRVP